jgi:AcrR family transcriptional regulator
MEQSATTKGENATPSARERLLDAALKVFASHGYDDASTREITEAAGTNVASINYYFGSKLELYTELVRTRARACQQMRMDAVKEAQAAGGDVKQIVRAFIHVHLCRSFGEDGPETDMALFFNEFATQGPGFTIIMEEMIHPTHKILSGLLIDSYHGMTAEKATLCIGSLMGQMVQFIRNRPIMKSINDRNDYPPSVEDLCDHIVDLTFHGLDGLFASGKSGGEEAK